MMNYYKNDEQHKCMKNDKRCKYNNRSTIINKQSGSMNKISDEKLTEMINDQEKMVNKR